MALKDLKKFSLSVNFYRQVVKPLHDSENFENRSMNSLKKMLRDDIHKAFWREQGPARYDAALAGKFQEILDVYKHAERKDHHAQLGALAGVGGDTVITKPAANETVCTKTIQFKTVDSGDVRGVEENISKAAWQLCGLGGEQPQAGGVNTIEIVILNTLAFDSYTEAQWASVISDALEEGYTQNRKGASAQQLYQTVNQVKITTVNQRFKFKVEYVAAGSHGTPERIVHFISKKPTTVGHGFTFHEKNFAKHWNWLKDNWWRDNVQNLPNKSVLIKETAKSGIGGEGAWQDLPKQPG